MIDYAALGRHIRAKRLAMGLSQEKLAELSEVGVTHISHIETGNTIPSLKTFLAIANALDVTTDALLCDSLDNARQIFIENLDDALADCTEEEVRIITDTALALKASLRARKKRSRG